jgi:superkiller protein 3
VFSVTVCAIAQDGQIKIAREKLNSGDTKGAIEVLLGVLKDNPKSADGHYWIGMAYHKNGQMNDALNSALTAFTIKPKHLLNRNLLLDIYLKKELFPEAKKETDFLLEESPKDPNLHLKNAECLIGLSQFETASIELSKLEVQKELSQSLRIRVLLLLGDVYARQRVNETAIAYYNKALAISANSVDTYLKLGKIYFREQQYNDALKVYLEAVRLDSNSREGNLNVGYIYYNGGKSNPQQYGNAIYYLQRYIALEPDDHQGYLFIGKSYHALRSYRNAIPPLEKAVELDTSKERDETIKVLAESYSGVNEYTKVISLYETLEQRAFVLDAKDYVRLGLAYKAVKDTLNTAKFFSRAAELDPQYHALYQDIGTMYYAGKNYSEAIQWFGKRVEAGPNDSSVATALQNLGLCQFYAAENKQDTLSALSSIRKAISLKPYSQSYWLVFAQISERADSVEASQVAYEVALTLDTTSVQAYFGLANISYRLKNNDMAIQYFKKVINLDENHKYAPYYLAQCYLRQKKNSAAIPYLKKYLDVEPAGSFSADAKKILKQLGAN